MAIDQPSAVCRQELQEGSMLIYASDLNPDSKDIRTMIGVRQNFPSDLFVMGNENVGIVPEMRELVGTFTFAHVRVYRVL
jgi:hypothetical protein